MIDDDNFQKIHHGKIFSKVFLISKEAMMNEVDEKGSFFLNSSFFS